MVRRILSAFLTGFFIIASIIAIGLPLLALAADALGARSFTVSIGALDIYRFTREGVGTSTELSTGGALAASTLGGMLNAVLTLLFRRLA
jgi:hypothetical protein